MIGFGLSEEQEVVRQLLRDFAAQVVRPAARDADEASKLPEEFLSRVHELSLISTQLPAAFGGGGEARSPITNAIILEELAFGDAALALAALAPAGFAFAIADQGTEEQKREHLPAFGEAGFHAAAVALVEPGPLFDPARLRTRAERAGRGAWRLSGAKSCVPLGDRADQFLVVADAEGGRQAFIVPRRAQGLAISPPEKNLGVRALPSVRLDLSGVEVPDAARLGGAAGCDVQRIVDAARTALAAVLTGLSRAALEYCVPYAKERRAFDQAIAQKQAIAFRLADMHIETECQRWLTWTAASRLEHGLPATREAHHARSYAARQAMWVADQGVQILGGHGFIREHPVELWYRHARTLSVLEGALAV